MIDFIKKHKLLFSISIMGGIMIAIATGTGVAQKFIIDVIKLVTQKIKRTAINLQKVTTIEVDPYYRPRVIEQKTGETLEEKVFKWAQVYDIDPTLAFALVTQESVGKPNAYRYEPGYYKKYIEPVEHWKKNPYYKYPERMSASYGLTQILYTTAVEVAKELKVSDKLKKPEDLYDPDFNLQLGLYYLKKLLNHYVKHQNPEWRALTHYNGGPKGNIITSSRNYADLVLRYREEYKKALKTKEA